MRHNLNNNISIISIIGVTMVRFVDSHVTVFVVSFLVLLACHWCKFSTNHFIMSYFFFSRYSLVAF
ncbi:hypothetical protein Hanom_Chr07g00673121 [Helianthus anomalus]